MKNPQPKGIEDYISESFYPITKIIKLKKPETQSSIDLLHILSTRRSKHGFNILEIEKIAEILWLSSRIISYSIQQNGYMLSKRPTPSAGGRHPIDILISMPTNERLFYYYNSLNHSLNELDLNKKIIADFISHIDESVNSRNSTIVWFIAHPARTTSKYENPESLIWRDAGALIYCFQIVCTALNINTCPLGTLGHPYVENLFNNKMEVYGVGGILIG